MRTFNRTDWSASLEAWKAGKFDAETWRDVRHQAAMKGMIYPPAGEPEDSAEDVDPSQRAIVYRALRDTPNMLKQAIDRSSSWHGVVEYLLARLTEWRDEINEREREAARRREEDEPGPRQATVTIGAILERIADSKGIVVAFSAGRAAVSVATQQAEVEANSFAPSLRPNAVDPSEQPDGQATKESDE